MQSVGFRPRTGGPDPKEPVGVFWVNDRSTLELDLRRSGRSNQSWRLRSFARAARRSRQVRGRMAASESRELALPTLSSSPTRAKAVVRAATGGPGEKMCRARPHRASARRPIICLWKRAQSFPDAPLSNVTQYVRIRAGGQFEGGKGAGHHDPSIHPEPSGQADRMTRPACARHLMASSCRALSNHCF